MAEPQAFDPSKPFTLVDAPPPPPPSMNRMGELADHPLVIHALPPNAEQWANTPLVRPTGTVIDQLSSPVNVAQLMIGAKPAVKAAVGEVSNLIGSLSPDVASEVIGMMTGRAGHVLRIVRKLGQAALAERPAAAPAEAAPVEAPAPEPSATGNNLPDQKALNEEAIARRRAEYQARTGSAATPTPPAAPPVDVPAQAPATAGAEPIVAASGKMQLTAPQFKEFQRLVQSGMKLPDALSAVKQAGDLAGRLGVPPPSVADTKFPKGMRGKR